MNTLISLTDRFGTLSVMACMIALAMMTEISFADSTDDAGFVKLFDGKTTAGWQGATDGYDIVDGELRCRKGAGGNLLTSKEYSDFD